MFEGAATLTPEWTRRMVQRQLLVDGDYNRMQVAQRMKILLVRWS